MPSRFPTIWPGSVIGASASEAITNGFFCIATATILNGAPSANGAAGVVRRRDAHQRLPLEHRWVDRGVGAAGRQRGAQALGLVVAVLVGDVAAGELHRVEPRELQVDVGQRAGGGAVRRMPSPRVAVVAAGAASSSPQPSRYRPPSSTAPPRVALLVRNCRRGTRSWFTTLCRLGGVMQVAVVTEGDPDRVSGGAIYHRRVADLAGDNGATVRVVSVPTRPFPLAVVDGPSVMRRATAGADVVVVDSLASNTLGPWLALGAGRRTPLVGSVHQDLGGVDTAPLRRAVQRQFDRLAWRRAIRLIVPSPHLADQLTAGGLPPAKLAVVQPGRDVPVGPASRAPRPASGALGGAAVRRQLAGPQRDRRRPRRRGRPPGGAGHPAPRGRRRCGPGLPAAGARTSRPARARRSA